MAGKATFTRDEPDVRENFLQFTISWTVHTVHALLRAAVQLGPDFVLGREQPADCRFQAQQLKVVSTYHFRVFIVRLVVPRDPEPSFVGCENALKDLVLVAQVLVHGIGEVVSAVAAKTAHGAVERAGPVKTHELPGILDRKHAQERLIHEREDGRVCSDAERQRQNGTKRE